jgi:hypothetical protein
MKRVLLSISADEKELHPELVRGFLRLDSLNFAAVEAFLRTTKDKVLCIKPELLLQQARYAYASSDKSLARTCVQKAITLNWLRGRSERERVNILRSLALEGSDFAKRFFEEQDYVMAAIASDESDADLQQKLSRSTVRRSDLGATVDAAVAPLSTMTGRLFLSPDPGRPKTVPTALAHGISSTALSVQANPEASARSVDLPGLITSGAHRETPFDPRFKRRPSAFYDIGRVFALLWHENLADTNITTSRSTIFDPGFESTEDRFGEKIYSTIRRMVVVRPGRGYSVCIQINTYGGRGLKKFNRMEDINAHSVIHMVGSEPCWLPEEARSSKRPISVLPTTEEQRLQSSSRLCYSKPYTIEHTEKTMDIGRVTNECLGYLIGYYRQEVG